jgi:hypothetical protein
MADATAAKIKCGEEDSRVGGKQASTMASAAWSGAEAERAWHAISNMGPAPSIEKIKAEGAVERGDLNHDAGIFQMTIGDYYLQKARKKVIEGDMLYSTGVMSVQMGLPAGTAFADAASAYATALANFGFAANMYDKADKNFQEAWIEYNDAVGFANSGGGGIFPMTPMAP